MIFSAYYLTSLSCNKGVLSYNVGGWRQRLSGGGIALPLQHATLTDSLISLLKSFTIYSIMTGYIHTENNPHKKYTDGSGQNEGVHLTQAR